jgi:hypothetical protein
MARRDPALEPTRARPPARPIAGVLISRLALLVISRKRCRPSKLTFRELADAMARMCLRALSITAADCSGAAASADPAAALRTYPSSFSCRPPPQSRHRRRYDAFCSHYGMTPTRNNPGVSESLGLAIGSLRPFDSEPSSRDALYLPVHGSPEQRCQIEGRARSYSANEHRLKG